MMVLLVSLMMFEFMITLCLFRNWRLFMLEKSLAKKVFHWMSSNQKSRSLNLNGCEKCTWQATNKRLKSLIQEHNGNSQPITTWYYCTLFYFFRQKKTSLIYFLLLLCFLLLYGVLLVSRISSWKQV